MVVFDMDPVAIGWTVFFLAVAGILARYAARAGVVVGAGIRRSLGHADDERDENHKM